MKEQEMTLAKVKKSCHTTRTLTNIVKIVTICISVLCLIGAVFCFTQQDLLDTALSQAVADGSATLRFTDPEINGLLQFSLNTEDALAAGQYGMVLGIYCICAAVVCLFTGVIFHLISKVFKSIELSGSPFSSDVLITLKKAFITLVVLILLFTGVGPGLFLGFILWSLYNILSYGSALQAEVDEIL